MALSQRILGMTLLSLSLISLILPVQAMTTMAGKPVKIEQLVGKGRWTAIEIWASDCGVCHRTIHHLVAIDQKLPTIDVFGISIDDQEGKADAQRFIQQNKMRFPNLLSNAAEVDSYLVKHADETFLGTPTMLLFSPKGKLIAVQPGPVTVEELKEFIAKS